ncbi:MAG: hypothetical protein JWO48_1397, partial [Bryobacterales bacterium]|nr:hypothetical protein [Bryobacterales bacterium]
MPALRQSALFHTHERAGAGLVDHHGWRVAAYYTWAQKEAEQLTKTAALADVSWMVKLDLKGYGLKTPPAVNDARAWRLGQQHYLVTCDPAASDGVMKQLRSTSAAPPDLSLPPAVYITDVTSVYSQLLLAGPPRSPALPASGRERLCRNCRNPCRPERHNRSRSTRAIQTAS